MKKVIFLTLIFIALISTGIYAQGSTDMAPTLQQVQEKQRPGLVEKVGLTAAQADKVIELNYAMRMQVNGDQVKSLSEADRSKKITELKAAKEKSFSEFLTPEQIKAMNTYYQDMRKDMPKKEAK